MGLTTRIEQFLLEMLASEDIEFIEIGRNELAQKFNCAPSQINYVLTTRFTPYKGYYVESRRGGGGYIKIIKLELSENELINNILNEVIKDTITLDKVKHVVRSLVDDEVLSESEAFIIFHSLDDNALAHVDMKDRNKLRADIFKNILLALLR